MEPKDVKENNVAKQQYEAEKMETGSVRNAIYLFYIKHISPISIFGCILCIASSQAFAMSANLWLSRWSDENTIKANSGWVE